jgi:uncharacterized protein involved in exopolysaccharide biosynthesis
MEYILYIGKFLYRIRWWLLIGTISITILAIFATKRLPSKYSVDCSVYTGVISGYSLEGDGTKDYAIAQNAIDNLINIIKSEGTLEKVCLRLYARCLIKGDPNKDNSYITAKNYSMIYNHLKNSPQGKAILSLINKNSEDITVYNFNRFYNSSKDNYLYGLFHYNMPHFCYKDLQRITVEREGSSDLLHLTYTDSDPGIAYNTLLILSSEFVNEYRSIRYGETDKVIDYFKEQLGIIGNELHLQENDLTSYNISKRVINYTDETKEIAAVNKEFELRYQDAMMGYKSAKSAIHELEKQMKSNTTQFATNMEFLNKLRQVSDLQEKVAEGELLSNSSDAQLSKNKNNLLKAQNELSAITNKYQKHQYTKEGIAKDNIVDEWLNELISYEKNRAGLKVMEKARQELNNKYIFFAPVGSTIKRKERSINFTEANYLSLLKSYDDALMRKKNLEMTSATLKVLNPPSYPLSPIGGVRKKIVLAVLVGSFLFILGFFLLLELLDQTLRDSIRARRITGSPVLGAFPRNSVMHSSNYNNVCSEMATKYLSSSILRFFNTSEKESPFIVNFISTDYGTGKSLLAEKLVNYWQSKGLKIRYLSYEKDFDPESKDFILSKSLTDIYQYTDENIIIVEYPSLKEHNIPTELLRQANLNLLIARADKGWKANDKILLRGVKEQAGETPFYLYLSQASRDEVQNYTGMLPPYTPFRRLMYRLSQLSLTESFNSKQTKHLDTGHIDEDDEE